MFRVAVFVTVAKCKFKCPFKKRVNKPIVIHSYFRIFSNDKP